MTSWSASMVLVASALVTGNGIDLVQSPKSPTPTAPVAQTKKAAVDISGTWAVKATFKGPPGMPEGGFPATVAFKQRGTEFDGDFRAPGPSGGPFTGTLKGKALTFTVISKHPTLPGVTDRVEFTGTVVDEKTIKGHVKSSSKGPGTDLGAEGPFVATRRR
jgi:hypothetical protein